MNKSLGGRSAGNRGGAVRCVRAGALLTCLCFFAALCGLVGLQQKGLLQTAEPGAVVQILFGLSVFLGSFLTARRAERRKLIRSLCTAVLAVLAVVPAAFCLNRGGEYSLLRPLLIAGLAGISGGLLGSKQKHFRYK